MQHLCVAAGAGIILGVMVPWSGLFFAIIWILLWLLQRTSHSCCTGITVRWLVALAVMSFASIYGQLWLSLQLQHRLPASLDRTDVELVLEVIAREGDSLQAVSSHASTSPAADKNRHDKPADGYQKVTVAVIQQHPLDGLAGDQQLPPLRRLVLGYYQAEPVLQVGDTLRAQVRLRAIRGFANGLPFDYEAWMLRQGIDGRGYIRSIAASGTAIDNAAPEVPLLTQWRQYGLERLQHIPSASGRRWVAGLVFGIQDAFSPRHWQLARDTGTLHLLVVSGLHLGLVAGVCGLLMGLVVRLLAPVYEINAGRRLWGSGIWIATVCLVYALLAGAGIALQRAWIMLLVVLLVMGLRRRLAPVAALSYAFVIVLLVNPLMFTSAGFGFSMMAVASLLLFLGGRRVNLWQGLWLPQWLVFLGLLPLMLWWGQAVGWVHLLCNAIAIPVLGLVMLPLSFLLLVWPVDWAVAAMEQLDAIWWLGLEQALEWPLPVVTFLPDTILAAVLLLMLLVYLGLRPGLSFLVISVALAVVFSPPGWHAPAPPQVRLLDVGQGQSLVVSAGGKALVYDLGASFGPEFSAAEFMLLPSLRRLGNPAVTDLVLSHSDSDHAGGLNIWLQQRANKVSGFNGHNARIWLGQPPAAYRPLIRDDGLTWPLASVQTCHGDDRWRLWSVDVPTTASTGFVEPMAVRFRFLRTAEHLHDNDNDASCVLQLEWFGRRVLVPGDISRLAEQALVARYGSELRSDVLVASHHGSASSSSRLFLQQVAPGQVWISAGFNNRYRHPSTSVIERLERLGIPWLSTIDRGAIRMDQTGTVTAVRDGWAPPWRQL
jgi:competence protein ComEC